MREKLETLPLAELKKDMITNPEKYAPWFFTAIGIAEAKKI